MNKSRPAQAKADDNPTEAKPRQRRDTARAEQPAATGAKHGSPAAPVMKQFAKTRAESTGRS